jgi:hypothetical protein
MKMNKTNIPDPDLNNLLKQTLKDDLPPEAETRMNRHFASLKRSLDTAEDAAGADRWMWVFRKEALAFALLIMLILGGLIHLDGYQSALANSISRLKVIVDVSAGLRRATSMDCSVLKRGAGNEVSRYRIRRYATGATRVDVESTNGEAQTLWISNATLPADPVWQPAMEFLTPTILAQHIEEQYGLTQAGGRDVSGPDQLLLIGRANQQVIEIAIDEQTYLPKTLKKYLPDSDRKRGEEGGILEARFQWNTLIPQ